MYSPHSTLAQPAPRPVEAFGRTALRALVQAIDRLSRDARFYEATHPGYLRAVEGAAEALEGATADGPVRLAITADGFVFDEEAIPVGQSRDPLHRRMYRDGLRALIFGPGASEEAALLGQAFQGDHAYDDLLTAFWMLPFEAIQIRYIDVFAEDAARADEPDRGFVASQVDGAAIVRDAVGETAAEDAGPGAASDRAPAGVQDTLYFLDSDEIRTLREEAEADWQRDLRPPVMAAFLDRLEDGDPARTEEVGEALRELLVQHLASHVESAAYLATELAAIAEEERTGADVARHLLDHLSQPGVLQPVYERLTTAPRSVPVDALTGLLAACRDQVLSEAVDALADQSGLAAQRLREAIMNVGRRHGAALTSLLQSSNSRVAVLAARFASQLELGDGHEGAIAMLGADDAETRLAGLEYLRVTRSAHGLAEGLACLDDPDVEVRCSAARLMARLNYVLAAEPLRETIVHRRFRKASEAEFRAFVDAYATLAGAKATAALEELLWGRDFWWHRRRPTALRAAAAKALATVGGRRALKVCRKAARDRDPVVRAVAQRSLSTLEEG